MSAGIALPRAIADAMVAHARAELPNESCGLLALRDGELADFTPSENAEPSPNYYRIAPRDALRVVDLEDAGDEVAIYHSHTMSPPDPSRTDVELAQSWPDALYLIVSLAREEPEIKAWRLVPSIEQVPLTIR